MKEKSHNATNESQLTTSKNSPSPAASVWDVSSAEVVIFQYSRAEALADGVLIDASNLAREAGFRHPVALTSAAWHTCVTVSPGDSVHDETGRLWDVLNVLRFAILASREASEIRFCVAVADERENIQHVELKALCGPGDDAEPVITIMLPDED